METLVKLLKEQTLEVRDKYVQSNIEWGKKDWDEFVKKNEWNDVDWCEYLKVPYEMGKNWKNQICLTFVRDFFVKTEYHEDLKRYYKEIYEVRRAIKKGWELYIKEIEENAIKHYENSIIKLAGRIEKKGLNLEKIELSTTSIDNNISTRIYDGEKTVLAWTILAWGVVYRPHYRYLVK